MDTSDRANRAVPAARSATFVSAWNMPETRSEDLSKASGMTRQNIAEPSTLMIDSPESQHADASYVTEWWLPCDEATAG